MSRYRFQDRQGDSGLRRPAPLPVREHRVISTTQDLIELDELMNPGSLYDEDPRWARVDEARDRRRAERMAAENSRPQLHHVLEVLPCDKKAA